jgi:hypothetical protein
VSNTLSGAVLASPKIVPVYFSNDDSTFVGQLEDFETGLVASAYWSTLTEYGVGAGSVAAPIVLTEAAVPIDDNEIQSWLSGKLNGDDPEWPVNDGNTLYVLHYPADITVTLAGEQSCQAYAAYHSETTLDMSHGNASVAYAVAPRCAHFSTFTGIDAATAAESAVVLAATTDPYPFDSPGWVTLDDAHLYWEFAVGGTEVSALCSEFSSSFVTLPDLPFVVQRIWSNQSALAGHDPCVPVPTGEVYFNATPELTLTPVTIEGQPLDVYAVSIPAGTSKTIDLDLFSDADTGASWDVTVNELVLSGSPHLSLELAPMSGQNGDKLGLTITTLSAPTSKQEMFVVSSTLGSLTTQWIGLVAN